MLPSRRLALGPRDDTQRAGADVVGDYPPASPGWASSEDRSARPAAAVAGASRPDDDALDLREFPDEVVHRVQVTPPGHT